MCGSLFMSWSHANYSRWELYSLEWSCFFRARLFWCLALAQWWSFFWLLRLKLDGMMWSVTLWRIDALIEFLRDDYQIIWVEGFLIFASQWKMFMSLSVMKFMIVFSLVVGMIAYVYCHNCFSGLQGFNFLLLTLRFLPNSVHRCPRLWRPGYQEICL